MTKRISSQILIMAIAVVLAGCGGSKNRIGKGSSKVKPIQLKYGSILGVDPKEITNEKVYHFIDEWMGTPYILGGESKRGIDCSAFAQYFYVDVYGYRLERTANKMYTAKSTDKFVGQEFLKEGDILFFKKPKSKNETVTHVGVYLKNNKFVSASGYRGPERITGVKISDLNHPWWQERLICAGRKPLPVHMYSTKEQ
ncbi:MAG: C40 family peptidase [Marinirhabdus sp.]